MLPSYAPATSYRERSFALSIVIPFYNEEEGAARFIEELSRVLDGIGLETEVLLVDDGSRDRTCGILRRSLAERTSWRVLEQGTNQGQAAALYRGLHRARAPIIVTLDGDGQNDPADIPRLLQRLADSGADMVAGVRLQRQDSRLRRSMSRFANQVRRKLLRDGVSDTGCGLKVFRREVVDAFIPIRTLYSFMPALAAAAGFEIVEEPVRHRARLAGESKYGLGVMLWRPFVDLLGVWWFTSRRFPRFSEAAA